MSASVCSQTWALTFWWGLMDPGLHITIPLLTSSLFSPRTRAPRLSPASARSRDLWNISIPEQDRQKGEFPHVYNNTQRFTLLWTFSPSYVYGSVCIYIFEQHSSASFELLLQLLSPTCDHWLDVAIVAYKLGVVSFLDETPLQSTRHHCTPAWKTQVTTHQGRASHFSVSPSSESNNCHLAVTVQPWDEAGMHFLQFFHTWDGINPLNGQKERFIQLSFGQRNVRIHDLQQFQHCICAEFRLSVLRWSKGKSVRSYPNTVAN